MKRLIILLILISVIVLPVSAAEFTAPTVPEDARAYMPQEPETFAEGLWFVIKSATQTIWPEVSDAAGVCLRVFAIVMLVGMVHTISEGAAAVSSLAAIVTIGLILLDNVNTLISLGTQTVTQLNEYGKLLLPVMTAAVAAQGGVTTSAAMYGGTVFFSTLLSTVITKCMIPLVYMFLALSVVSAGTSQELIVNLKSTSKNVLSWVLKTVLYVFTGYMTITGVVSGTTDAATLKAAKLTITGAVPVVGGILSDASEAVLVGAGMVKNSVGIYGLLAVISICVGPFIKIAVQYLLLKVTSAASSTIGNKQTLGLIKDFSTAMGIILAMVGTQCVLLLISTVCLMKGVS